MIEKKFNAQVMSGERFEFGKNWKSFLNSLTEERIKVAENSLKEMLSLDDLSGKTFLDIGCGSGLFSLAAKNLNATVHSIDFDIESVKCTECLKKKYHPDSNWIVEEGSALDKNYLTSLGQFDIVYSWGVLHHTGNMILGLNNASIPVNKDGILFIAIYNDQGRTSKIWLRIKQIYNSNLIGKTFITSLFFSYYSGRGFLEDILSFKNPIIRYREYKKRRGMSMTHDWIDWIGGLPFEVASPEFIVDFYKAQGFSKEKIKATNSSGCNQFVLKKTGNNKIKNS